jgi:hypothetical protein
VKYDDGEAEDLTLADERVKFFVSSEEMKCLNLKLGISNLDKKGYDELLALAVSFHDYQGLDPGDLVWAKITGTTTSSLSDVSSRLTANSMPMVLPILFCSMPSQVLLHHSKSKSRLLCPVVLFNLDSSLFFQNLLRSYIPLLS